MNLEYKNDLANVVVILSQGGYSWTYTDENGKEQSVVADSAHILDWDQLVDVTLQDPADLTLAPSQPLKDVEVTRWPADARGKGSGDVPEGETVKVTEEDGSFHLKETEPGYVYLVKGIWENGTAEFGFYTK